METRLISSYFRSIVHITAEFMVSNVTSSHKALMNQTMGHNKLYQLSVNPLFICYCSYKSEQY